MSVRPAAPTGAGMPLAVRRAAVSVGTPLALSALTLALLPAAPAHAQTAQEILKKVNALYDSAKSYSGTQTLTQKATVQGKQLSSVRVTKTQLKGPSKINVQITENVTGQPAGQPSSGSVQLVSDGKTLVQYNS